MIYLDEATWERTESVEKYADYVFPYISLSVNLDVTNLLRYAKEQQLSFYCAMMHTAVRAALEIKNFSYRLVDGKPALCERLDPLFVHLPQGSEQYVLVHGEYCEDLRAFCRECAERMKGVEEEEKRHHIQFRHTESMELLYITCVPWIQYTHLIRTYKDPKTDVVPRLSWGKFEADEQGKMKMPFSVQVHHGLVDGYHVGMYLQRLQEMIDAFD